MMSLEEKVVFDELLYKKFELQFIYDSLMQCPISFDKLQNETQSIKNSISARRNRTDLKIEEDCVIGALGEFVAFNFLLLEGEKLLTPAKKKYHDFRLRRTGTLLECKNYRTVKPHDTVFSYLKNCGVYNESEILLLFQYNDDHIWLQEWHNLHEWIAANPFIVERKKDSFTLYNDIFETFECVSRLFPELTIRFQDGNRFFDRKFSKISDKLEPSKYNSISRFIMANRLN